ncbi:beta-1,3-galactosyltransferase 5 [Octodon degus]|uniref:Hexosyltransferase n=1 Tax=Octodon degus TaxID=10160 RepID=A0A6P6EHF1_OCTDE|nr:beta-1,3-galactosyltransferase 5 [Octodon degus]XP_023571721.1 beta-1,3-galactosyltransferase 5 [Octodon degus]XP_023571722.1 beta-1,3-galactosyltransferase 5 [Octodon degus]XP_023571723.1 beta-1,3-galactosyltransferase 5 [Octodon degus]XP_023571724.1 beta-1,3-galactosyltransferase 5 [Octodon degus]XP_023571725.1 beta-1,3-galactosyltransferase 5 [Octodon degus]XP_023571726.1 beta-1,3-galactosyltransferase 5 [Octodon degus]XP_023571727.1 beta-1,3-galactosyltransferase 5 [Octodon degus]XP_
MALPKMRLLYTCLLGIGVLCLYFSMEAFKEGKFIFKKNYEQFLQIPDIDCKRHSPFLVLLVTSSPQQVAARMAIRKTWGQAQEVRGQRVRTFFLLGTRNSKEEMMVVAQESKTHGDIIQKNFKDVYFNLTLKTMMGMEWVHRFCPQAAFVMKTDTDMFINVPYLTELLLKKNRTAGFFTGYLKLKELPIRSKLSKWYVSHSEYPWSKYPPFCSGTAYVFSSDVASRVYNISDSIPFIKLEDVFVGLCLAKLGILPEELHSQQTFFPEGLHFSTCRFKKVVACHFVKPQELLTYWQALQDSKEGDCKGV